MDVGWSDIYESEPKNLVLRAAHPDLKAALVLCRGGGGREGRGDRWKTELDRLVARLAMHCDEDRWW